MNVNCSSSTGCPVLLNSECVFYEGANLPYTGISTNDDVQTCFEKIESIINGISTSAIWGNITGNIGNQTDLITYLASNYVPQARTITINGTSFDLSANRTWSNIGHVIENSGTSLTPRANLNFTNALTASDNSPDTDVKLGGLFVENTNIDGAFDLKFGDSINLTSFVAKANILVFMATDVSGSVGLRFNDGGGNSNNVYVNSGGVQVELTATKTFASVADYSADFVALSYIHKGYADATYAPISGGAYWSSVNGATLTGANTVTGTTVNILKFVFNSLGVTQTNGAGNWLANTTAAAAGSQQISPSTVWEGQGHATTPVNSQSVKYIVDVLPVQGTANPTGTWRLRSSIDGAAYSDRLSIASSGLLTVFGGATFNNSVAQTGANNSFNNSGSLTTNATVHFSSSGAISGGNTNFAFNVVNTINSAGGTVVSFDSEQTITNLSNLTGFKHDPVNPSNITGTHLAFHGVTGSILLGDTTKSANTGEKVVILSNASTNASAAQINGIVLHSKDSSDAASTLALYTEQVPEATATFTQTHRIKVWWNNQEFWISLDAV